LVSVIVSKLKTYALAILSVLAAVFFALFKGSQAARAKEKLDASENARETEQKATQALVDGLESEQEARNEDIDTSKRDHFS